MAAPKEVVSPAAEIWWKKRWAQNSLIFLCGVIGVYGLIYWDVVSRARESYEEGEKYMAWNAAPEKKQEFFERKFRQDKAAIDELLAKNKISAEEHKRRLDAFEFDKEYALGESSLKYAYQWYKDTYELFSPPESKWVRLARAKAPEVLEQWKEELRQQNVPFEDYMFE